MTTHDAVNFGAGGGVPIGTILALMGTTPPAGYFICDGSVYDVTLYPFLADYFEEQFGTKNYFGGDGENTFAVPDLRGEFLRGSGTNGHAGEGSGLAVGVHQAATYHLHSDMDGKNKALGCVGVNGASRTVANADATPVNGNVRGFALSTNQYSYSGFLYYTSRPTNTSVLYCIRC